MTTFFPAAPAQGYIDPHWRTIVPPTETINHPRDHAPNVPFPPAHPVLTPPPDPSPSSWQAALPSIPSKSKHAAVPSFDSETDFPALGSSKPSTASTKSSVVPSRATSVTTLDELSEQGKQKSLDRFASVYTPAWLKHLAQPIFTATLPPTPVFPPANYAETILPPGALSKPLPISTVCPSVLSVPPGKRSPPHLDEAKAIAHPKYYAEHFTELLSLHLDAQINDMANAMIYILPVGLDPAQPGTYRLHIPGIREDQPRLFVGDRILFRGLYPDHRVPSNAAVEAEVVGLQKAAGMVFVRSFHLAGLHDSLAKVSVVGWQGPPPAMYQIRFLASSNAVCMMQDAVRAFTLSLNVKFDVARKWLFPTKEDAEGVAAIHLPSIRWHDDSLNEEQKHAVSSVVSYRHQIPYLISGPPGTGKTKTLVEAVLQILQHHPSSSILVCAPSNPAADTIARRLAKSLKPGQMLRLNAPNRTFAEVADEVMTYCYIKDDTFSIPPFEELMRTQVVVCSCMDASILVSARATNAGLMQAQYDLYKVLQPRGGGMEIKPHWTHLIIDEAAQASEPEALVPMSVVLPYPLPADCPTENPVVVLCGDIYQLGPVISSYAAREGGFDVSLLERLFNRDVYADHPAARKHRRGQARPYPYLPPFADLIRNYRSIAPILMVPAALFYNDSLIASAEDVNLVTWSKLPNPRIPILFQGCETEENWIEEGASWYNPGEIDIVVDMVRSITTEMPDLPQKQIAVITPWREQVWKLRGKLREAGFGGVDTGNVETYQGGEFRVTILSCVRSQERFLKEDKKANMGLFNEAKRFNVAITRAKELLVVVGNANLLKADPYWNGFLQIAMRNGLYVGPEVGLELTDDYQSRIEFALRSELSMGPEETMSMLAGAMARQTLRED